MRISTLFSKPNLVKLICLVWVAYCLYSIFFVSVKRYGDTSNYVMMTRSIIYDHDLKYEAKDLTRALNNPFCDVPAGLFLTPTKNGYYYGKPLLYSLVSAPFYMAFKEKGFIIFNFLLYSLIILIGYLHLKKENDETNAFLYSFFFFFLSSSIVYVFWISPEILMMFLVTLALYLSFRTKPNLCTVGLLFGLLTSVKIAMALIYIAFLLLGRNKNVSRKMLLYSILTFIATFLSASAYQWIATGTPICYTATRHFFITIDSLPYLHGPGAGGAVKLSTIMTPLGFDLQSFWIFGLSSYYFLLGRFTGILPYYMPSVNSLQLCQRWNRRKIFLLIIVFVYGAIHVIFRYNNYHGGTHAVGNRYFLIIFPVFLFIVDKIRFGRLTNIIFMISFLFNLPFIIAPNKHSHDIYTHTVLPHYKIFPVEKTLLATLFFRGTTFKLRPQNFMIDIFEGRWAQTHTVAGTKSIFYFLNGYLYTREDLGFYVENNDTCELIFSTNTAGNKQIVFPVQNHSPQQQDVIINVASQKKRISLLPGETAEVAVDIENRKFPNDYSNTQNSLIDIAITVRGPHLWGWAADHFKAQNKEMVFFDWPALQ